MTVRSKKVWRKVNFLVRFHFIKNALFHTHFKFLYIHKRPKQFLKKIYKIYRVCKKVYLRNVRAVKHYLKNFAIYFFCLHKHTILFYKHLFCQPSEKALHTSIQKIQIKVFKNLISTPKWCVINVHFTSFWLLKY